MTYLVSGVLLWALMHFMPAVPARLRASLIEKTSPNAYKGIAGLLIIASIVLMVMGWKATSRELAFMPMAWANELCFILMLLASVMFFAPYVKNSISRVVRHPQLVGFLLWGIGHVLATGQVRSLVLFGGLGLWAIIQIVLLNRRDGAWEKPAPASVKSNLVLLVTGAVVFLVLLFSHLYLFGVPVIPG